MPQMHSTPTTTARSGTRSSTRAGTSTTPRTRRADAIALLKADHAAVQKLFRQYDKLSKDEAPDEEREALARTICQELEVHTTLEESLVYPAAREAIDKADLVDEAEVEHASAKVLIGEIRGMQPHEPLYDAKVKVLGEYVKHHIQEEQDEMFPAMRKARMDLRELGEQLQTHKQALLAELDGGDGGTGKPAA